MAPSNHLGLFGKLPREIRDEIYFNVLGHVYMTGDERLVDLETRKPLSILAVARQISWEASQTLPSRSTLHFDGDAEIFPWDVYATFTNISITLDANLGIIYEDSERADEIYREVEAEDGDAGFDIYSAGGDLLHEFTGARDTAHLQFSPIGGDHAVFSRFKDQPPLICSTELRSTIKQLVGFLKVVMVLDFVVKAGDANLEAWHGGGGHRNNRTWNFVRMIIDVNNTDPFDSQDKDCFKRLTADVGKDFEKELGSFATHFIDRPNGDFAGIITYHPRKASDTRNKAAMAEKAFPQVIQNMVESSLVEERAIRKRQPTRFSEAEKWASILKVLK